MCAPERRVVVLVDERGEVLMDTIGGAVRQMFIQIMRDEIIELLDRAETLKNAEMYDSELKHELEAAYEHLFKARVRADELGGDS